ncbi:MAG: serine/threonine protein kinase [Lentisphaeraceae bacterium]|nr:serine/threonine protein kinase [Lentisphaeraceae bacterium]
MSFLEDIYDSALEKLDTLNNKGLNSFHSLKNLDERYSHFQEVNRGGLKKIISANDEVTDRLVAIAFLKKKNPQLESSFVHEARLNAKLQHPNIIPIYDIGYDEEQGPFFTMKLIEGESLGQILSSLRESKELTSAKYPQNEMVEIFRKVCDAVYYAHNCGVIHLDLKPENIQIGRFGEVLVCDWGMAKVLDEECNEIFISDNSEGLANVTLNGEVKGTPGYMAPEQIEGQSKDQRTDIYGLGCILYSLLTWELPIEGKDLTEVLSNTTKGKFKSPIDRSPEKGIPDSLNAVVMKCMKVSPTERYQSVKEVIDEVDRFSRGFSTQALDAGFKKQLILLYRRNSVICQIVFAALLFLIGIVSFFIYNLNIERDAALLARSQAETAEQKSREIALDLQKEKELKLKNELQKTYDKISLAWRSGDLDNLDEVRELIQVCFDLQPGNKRANYHLGHLAMLDLDFKKAFELYKAGSGYDSQKMAEYCRQQIDSFTPNTDVPPAKLIRLNHDLIKLVKTSLHRVMSRKMIEESDNFKRTLELAEGYFKIDNRHLKNFSLIDHYDEKTGILSLKQLHSLDLRIISLLDIKGLDLSGSEVRFYQHREKNVHYSYLNFSDTNITGLPFSGKNLETLFLSSRAKNISFLEKCPALTKLYIPEGKFTEEEIFKYCKNKIQIIEF